MVRGPYSVTEDQIGVVLNAISDARQESTKGIGDLGAKVEAYHADLHARVTTLEVSATREATHQWINTLLVPIYALLHAVGVHMGIKS